VDTGFSAEIVWHRNCIELSVSTTRSSRGKRRSYFRGTGTKVAQAVQVGQLHYRSYSADDGRSNEVVCMTEDFAAENDRRGSQRFKISAPLTVITGGHEISAFTRDLSNRGVYFYLALADSALIDRDFEFLIEMPSEITLASNCRIRCRGRLVRKEMTSRNLTGAGVAAEILDYSILREAVSTN
jgi:hypothetical protein